MSAEEIQKAISSTLPYGQASIWKSFTPNSMTKTVDKEEVTTKELKIDQLTKEELQPVLFQILFQLFVSNSQYGITYNGSFNLRYDDNATDITYIIEDDKFVLTTPKHKVYFTGTYARHDDKDEQNHIKDLIALSNMIPQTTANSDPNLKLFKEDLKDPNLAFGLPAGMKWGAETGLYHPYFSDYYTETTTERGEGLKHKPVWSATDSLSQTVNDIEKEITDLKKVTLKDLVTPTLRELFELIYEQNNGFTQNTKLLYDKYAPKMNEIMKILSDYDKNNIIFAKDFTIKKMVTNGVIQKTVSNEYYGGTITSYYPKALERIFWIMLQMIQYIVDKNNMKDNLLDLTTYAEMSYSDQSTNFDTQIKQFRQEFGGLGGRTFNDIFSDIEKENDISTILALEKEAKTLTLDQVETQQLNDKMKEKIEIYANDILTQTVDISTTDDESTVNQLNVVLKTAEDIDSRIKDLLKDRRNEMNIILKDLKDQTDEKKTIDNIYDDIRLKNTNLVQIRDTKIFTDVENQYTKIIHPQYVKFMQKKQDYETRGTKLYYDFNLQFNALTIIDGDLKDYIDERRKWFDITQKLVEDLGKIKFQDANDINELENMNNEFRKITIPVIEYTTSPETTALQKLYKTKNNDYTIKIDIFEKKEAARKAQEEADRKAQEEADRKAQEEADRKAQEEADRKAKEEAEKNKPELEKLFDKVPIPLKQYFSTITFKKMSTERQTKLKEAMVEAGEQKPDMKSLAKKLAFADQEEFL